MVPPLICLTLFAVCLTIFPSLNLPSQLLPKKIVHFSLPFTGTHSLQIHTQISRLCIADFPHLNIRLIFRFPTQNSTFFQFKDKLPKYLRSSVVYSFTCRCYSASYVGQTTRHTYTLESQDACEFLP